MTMRWIYEAAVAQTRTLFQSYIVLMLGNGKYSFWDPRAKTYEFIGTHAGGVSRDRLLNRSVFFYMIGTVADALLTLESS